MKSINTSLLLLIGCTVAAVVIGGGGVSLLDRANKTREAVGSVFVYPDGRILKIVAAPTSCAPAGRCCPDEEAQPGSRVANKARGDSIMYNNPEYLPAGDPKAKIFFKLNCIRIIDSRRL